MPKRTGEKVKTAAPRADRCPGPEETAAKEIIHEFANLQNKLRMRCETFLNDFQEGFLNQKTDRQNLDTALRILRQVIESLDGQQALVEKLEGRRTTRIKGQQRCIFSQYHR
ncbi:MAG: hypothetical protein HQL23_02980 [Candidatus Omnitrophica bacterium]|nr:hypothetical protein [Candidatus Omnitrophota bacterium]